MGKAAAAANATLKGEYGLLIARAIHCAARDENSWRTPFLTVVLDASKLGAQLG